MKKVVAIFEDQENAQKAEKELIKQDISDFTLVKLGEDYEQQVQQVIFFKPKEFQTICCGAILGGLIFAALFYFLTQNNEFSIILGRLMAGGQPVVLVTGAGIGLAIGGLLTGLYYLSQPLSRDCEGHLLMVLYTKGPYEKQRALRILEENSGLITG